MVKSKALIPKQSKEAKLVAWRRAIPSAALKLEKGSRAAVVVDKDDSPQLFIFDTFALLDILSAIDEALVDRLSTRDYYSKKGNPAGWLIDQIESQLPLNPEYIKNLKEALDEAEDKGWVPFSRIQSELNRV